MSGIDEVPIDLRRKFSTFDARTQQETFRFLRRNRIGSNAVFII
jgi:hypothetical protein